MNRTNILLESGTNELEFIEFKIDKAWYGLNVAKVREIILMSKLTKAANMHKSVEGIFDHRGEIIPLINLAHWLERPASEDPSKDKIIICDINNTVFGFRVHLISRIHRISWDQLESPQSIIASTTSAITGVIKQESKLILMMDIERIINDIEPIAELDAKNVKNIHNIQRQNVKIYFADDSPMIRSIAEDTFTKSGYSKINISKNGKELLNKLLEIKSLCRTKNKPLSNYIDVLITDIEMPQIDGMFLIKKIREDSLLTTLPIVVFSSISDNQIKEKTKKLGANYHVPKPKIEELIHTIDELIRLKSK